ncbi:hypothetical protein SDC9_180273 [bioreactor metagenome]|uniref:Phospholipid/glycerol acyltransferase domain-containing protein n=1 Tax=bioreactor metagenome TaxID=1076179 RepID=A0A645HAH2_9ZZZZ
MKDPFARFNMLAIPKRQKLRLIAWAISYPDVWAHRAKIEKIAMDGIRPPYLLLCNHNAFLDFGVREAS